ncbi:MAG TPA: hypothetical protein VJ693_05155 [Ideonella sp.]|nr:hypothetical protein [Ideonella sp.]
MHFSTRAGLALMVGSLFAALMPQAAMAQGMNAVTSIGVGDDHLRAGRCTRLGGIEIEHEVADGCDVHVAQRPSLLEHVLEEGRRLRWCWRLEPARHSHSRLAGSARLPPHRVRHAGV